MNTCLAISRRERCFRHLDDLFRSAGEGSGEGRSGGNGGERIVSRHRRLPSAGALAAWEDNGRIEIRRVP